MTSFLYSLLSLLVGLILGNWLGIGRDRRKEHNSIVDPIITNLNKQLISTKEHIYPITANYISQYTFAPLYPHISEKQKNRIEQAYLNYINARGSAGHDDEEGKYVFSNPDPFIESISRLLSTLKRK